MHEKLLKKCIYSALELLAQMTVFLRFGKTNMFGRKGRCKEYHHFRCCWSLAWGGGNYIHSKNVILALNELIVMYYCAY